MSSRRTSGRASAAKRQSYREDSDDEDQVELSEDEYQLEEHVDASADEALEAEQTTNDEDEDEEEQERTPKKRKKNPKSRPSKSKSKRSNGTTHDEWAPGVTRIVTKLIGPPTTGHVARGELSPNMLKFLTDLQPNNDRDWFAKHDAVYRYVWKNFNEFAEAVLNDIMDNVDDTVPWLPTKDLVYRIYRDVRFSNDKTPYKSNFMASFSRGGRKGPFAGYHLLIKPDGRSFFAAGRWQPEREDLAVIRQHILVETPEAQQLKAVVKHPTFIKWYGPPKTDAKAKTAKKSKPQSQHHSGRSSLWGGDDELKVAPKIDGVDKTHKDIDWLKLRSFVVVHNFTDAEVLGKNFRKLIVEAGKVAEPLVRKLNSMTSPDPPPPPESDGEEQDVDGDDGANEDEDQDQDQDEDEQLLATEELEYNSDEDQDLDDDDNDDDD